MNRTYFRAMLCGLGFFILLASNLAIAAFPAADTIIWHSSVKKGAVFGWKLTTLAPTNPDMPFDMGGQTLHVGDPLFFAYTDDPPTDPATIYDGTNAPNFIDLYIKEKKVSWDDVAQQSVIFLGLIVPLQYSFDNGTSLDLSEIVKLPQPSDYNVNVTEQSNHLDVNVTVPSGVIEAFYKISKSTGVASELTVTVVFYGVIKWEYDSSLELPEDGADSSEDGDDSLIPGFEVLSLFAGLGLSVVLVYKKRRK
ncbi:MAG: hypothetical protein ACFFGZ_13205 [Candidatus Thorarchaeota archaeon]